MNGVSNLPTVILENHGKPIYSMYIALEDLRGFLIQILSTSYQLQVPLPNIKNLWIP